MKFSQTMIKGMIKKGIFGAMALLMMLSFGCSKEELVLDQVQADGGKKGKTVRVEGQEVIGTGDEVDPKGPIGPEPVYEPCNDAGLPFFVMASNGEVYANAGIDIDCLGNTYNTKKIQSVLYIFKKKCAITGGCSYISGMSYAAVEYYDNYSNGPKTAIPWPAYASTEEGAYVVAQVTWVSDGCSTQTSPLFAYYYSAAEGANLGDPFDSEVDQEGNEFNLGTGCGPGGMGAAAIGP